MGPITRLIRTTLLIAIAVQVPTPGLSAQDTEGRAALRPRSGRALLQRWWERVYCDGAAPLNLVSEFNQLLVGSGRNNHSYDIYGQDFFNHHLKGMPAPSWMTDGVPQVDKDRHLREYAPQIFRPRLIG
jgi:hypothetical protein